MEANPFTKRITALQVRREKSSNDLAKWEAQLSCYQSTNLEQLLMRLKQAQREYSDAVVGFEEGQKALRKQESTVELLEEQATLGLDPRSWVSPGRAMASRQLIAKRQAIEKLRSELASIVSAIPRTADLCRELESEVRKIEAFDPNLAQAVIDATTLEIERHASELENLAERSASLDAILVEPMTRLRMLKDKESLILTDIARAEGFEAALASTSKGLERWRIHAECGHEFGDDSPTTALRHLRKDLRPVQADIKKLWGRIERVMKFAEMDIRHLVIDGSNLCYQADEFIGLVALEALVPEIAENRAVTLIFDGTIRRKLGMNSKDIAARLPHVDRLHIASSRRGADETVLAVAGEDPYACVISNDRYADYPEKSAVKDGRLITHAILSDMVVIDELQIKTPFSSLRRH